MKLKKVLKHIDPVNTNCHIYETVHTKINNENYEEIYQGSLFDIPWYIADKHIDSDMDSEGIHITQKNNKNIIHIYVKNKK